MAVVGFMTKIQRTVLPVPLAYCLTLFVHNKIPLKIVYTSSTQKPTSFLSGLTAAPLFIFNIINSSEKSKRYIF